MSKLLNKVLEETPQETESFVDLYTDILLQKQTKEELQERIDKANLFRGDRVRLMEMLCNFDLSETDFTTTSKTHDWRNYVPEEWIKLWKSFTDRERYFIYTMAEEKAESENWD